MKRSKRLGSLLSGLALSMCLSSSALAGPCSILMASDVPCEIEWGEPAPYSGTLMTTSTARSLADKVYELEDLQIDFNALKLASQVSEDTYEKRILDLKVRLENAPRPLLEQPLFWIVSIAALGGGIALGVSL